MVSQSLGIERQFASGHFVWETPKERTKSRDLRASAENIRVYAKYHQVLPLVSTNCGHVYIDYVENGKERSMHVSIPIWYSFYTHTIEPAHGAYKTYKKVVIKFKRD